MTDQLTPKDQLEYYQSLLDNLLEEENTDINRNPTIRDLFTLLKF